MTWDGWLGRAAKLYATGPDLKDPQLSPIYGDFTGFPPAILTTGTRDLFLSNTVRTHRKLRRAGVERDLNVYEGQSHAQYGLDPDAPETKEAFTDIARFFDRDISRNSVSIVARMVVAGLDPAIHVFFHGAGETMKALLRGQRVRGLAKECRS